MTTLTAFWNLLTAVSAEVLGIDTREAGRALTSTAIAAGILGAMLAVVPDCP